MACSVGDKEKAPGLARRRLQKGGELVTVGREDAVILIAGHDEGRRIFRVLHQTMIGRNGEQVAKVRGRVGIAIFEGPLNSAREKRKPGHIEYPDLRYRCAEQRRVICGRSGRQKPAVAGTADGDLLPARPAFGDERFRGPGESVEDIALVLQHTKPVPFLTILEAAGQGDNSQDSAVSEPRDIILVELGQQVHAKPTIPEQIHGRIGVKVPCPCV